MKIASILQNDLANGPGLRTTIFISGCHGQCKGCHNPHLWDFNIGTELTVNTIKQIIELLQEDGIKRNLSIIGGEPLHEANLTKTLFLCRKVKEKIQDIEIAIWTGYNIHNNELFKDIDIVIDGKFDENLTSGYHPWRGSSNQRILKRIDNEFIEIQEWI